jgi:hypothetical protein
MYKVSVCGFLKSEVRGECKLAENKGFQKPEF